MSDQVASAVLSLSTDNAQVYAGLDDLKARIKSVASTVGETSNASENDWATMARAISAVSKQLGEQKANTDSLKQGTHGLGEEMHSVIGLAKEVAGAIGLAFTIDAAIEFQRHVLESAASLKTLSEQSQISIEDLQVLTAATGRFGVSGEELGRALFQLKQRIAGGDDSVATAYHLMGLSLDDVRDKNAVELFLTTERGLNTLSGALKDTAAADLYGGKLGTSLVAFSTGVDEAIDRARKLNTVASGESVKALAEYKDAIDQAKRSLDSWVTEIEGQAASGFNTLVDAANRGATKWQIFVAMFKDFAASNLQSGASASNLATLLDHLNQKTEANTASTQGNAAAHRDLAAAHGENAKALTAEEQAARFMAAARQDAIKPLLEYQKRDLDQLEQLGQLNEKNAAAVGVTAAQYEKYKAGLETQKKFIESWTSLNALGETYQATLDGLDPDLRAEVEYYAKIGATVDQLTAGFPKLAAAQAKAAVDAAQETKNAQKIAIEETTKIWDDYTKIVTEHTGTSTQVQIAAIDQWAADLTAKMQKAKADTAAFYDALAADTTEKMRAVLVDWKAIADTSAEIWQQNLQDTANKAAATYQYMVEHAEQFRADTIAKWRDIADQAAIAADEWYQSWNDHLDALDQKLDETDQKVKDTTAAMTAVGTIVQGGDPRYNTAEGRLQLLAEQIRNSPGILINSAGLMGGLTPRASGGPVSAGVPYLVGEKRAEVFVPEVNGSIMPNAAAFRGVTVNISTGPIYDGKEFERRVRRAIDDGLRGSGARIGG